MSFKTAEISFSRRKLITPGSTSFGITSSIVAKSLAINAKTLISNGSFVFKDLRK